ncbi:MAG: N-acetylglucosamine-6-phosphate deacetylase [Acidimicrobiales bacterium]
MDDGRVIIGQVHVKDGLIEAVEEMQASPSHPTRPAMPDRTIVPGFVDIQVNGIGAIDVADARQPDAWDALDDALLAQGVTTWCPTLVSAPLGDLDAALGRIDAFASRPARAPRPSIAGAHVEGPFLTVPGAHDPRHLLHAIDMAWLGGLPPLVRIITLAPELPGAVHAVEVLHDRGIVVALGHSRCSAQQALSAASAGASLVTHLGNAMPPLAQREPGLFGAGLTDDRLAISLIADLVHLHPSVLDLAWRAKPPGRLVLVTDSVAAGSGKLGPVKLGPVTFGTGEAIPDAARLSDGTLAGSVVTMDRAVANLVANTRATLPDAVASASRIPARLLGLADRGSIAPGMRADLVALRPDGSIEAVWIGGRIAWPRPAGWDMPGRTSS